MASKVRLQLVDPGTMDDVTRGQVVRLVGRLRGLAPEEVEFRLASSTFVVLLREAGAFDVNGALFVRLADIEHLGRAVRALYLSDVALDAEHRTRNVMQRVAIRVFLKVGLFSRRELYWFITADSFEGYRLTVRSFASYPRADGPTPRFEASLTVHLCRHLFGADWSAETGLVRGCARGRSRVSGARSLALADADFQCFRRLNPRSHLGEALPLLARMNLMDACQAALRTLRAWINSRDGKAVPASWEPV